MLLYSLCKSWFFNESKEINYFPTILTLVFSKNHWFLTTVKNLLHTLALPCLCWNIQQINKKKNYIFMNVCSCHVTYTFQSESTLYTCLNVKELLAQSRREIWSLSDCNWTRTQNHLIRKQTFNHWAKWLSVHLRTKWFWVRVQLQLHFYDQKGLKFLWSKCAISSYFS